MSLKRRIVGHQTIPTSPQQNRNLEFTWERMP